jgi:dolichyl-phosphate beta-glucosyltransferase
MPSSLDKYDVSLILPAYNEAATIVQTVSQAFEYFRGRGLRAQVIVSADGNDGTREKIREMALSTPGLCVVGSPERGGKGKGIRRGMAIAEGTFVGFADADNKVPIEEYSKVELLLKSGAAVVIGSRAHPDAEIVRRQPLYRRLGSRAFKTCIRTLIGLPDVSDSQCGFKFFPLSIGKRIFEIQKVDGYMYDVEILLIANRLGHRIHEVPVRWRDDGDSRLDLVRGNIQNVLDILKIAAMHRDLTPVTSPSSAASPANVS